MAISMLKIRRPLGRLIFNMGIAIPGKTVFLIETAPWGPSQYKDVILPFTCLKIRGRETVLSLTWDSPYLERLSLYWEGAQQPWYCPEYYRSSTERVKFWTMQMQFAKFLDDPSTKRVNTLRLRQYIYFQVHFLEMLVFDSKFTEIFSQLSS